MSYERMIAERESVERQIMTLEQEVNELPEGKLLCAGNGSYCKWYHKIDDEKHYIPKKEHKLAERLAKKKYLLLQLEDLLHEKEAIELYLNHRKKYPDQTSLIFTDKSEFQKLLSPQLKHFNDELFEWQNSPYDYNKKYPEQLIHKTVTGQLVRSKSEALITMILHKYGIPFRYECKLLLGKTILYPDFTVKHPKTGKTYYWEHFGKMDDHSYIQNTCSKMQLYALHGIVPSIQLIATFETKEHPLSLEYIENIVREYFLME